MSATTTEPQASIEPYATVVLTDSEDGVYHAQKDTKDHAWEISHPAGGESFHGTKAQVTSLMKKIIKVAEQQMDEEGRPETEVSGHESETFSGG